MVIMKEIISPNVPKVINIQPPETGKLVLAQSKAKTPASHRTVGGKTVLPHSQYKDELEKVIQRDFFPGIDEEEDRSLSSASAAPLSLHNFHVTTTSDRHVRLQTSCSERSLCIRTYHEQRFKLDHKYKRVSGQSNVRNPIFFGPPTKTSVPSEKQGNPCLLLEAGTPSPPSISIRSTRFSPVSRPVPIVPNHWEGNSVADDLSASDTATDLDSTVVASIRAEIRQARARGMKRPTPPLDPSPFSYNFPAESARETQASVALESKRAQRLPTGRSAQKKKKKSLGDSSLGKVLQSAYSKKKRKTKKRKL